MDHLYRLYEMVDEELKTLSRKEDAMKNADCAKYVDLLAHTAKDLLAVIAMQESEQDGGTYGRGYRESGYNRGGYGESNGYGEGGYGARGRGRNARRNSMGRYAAGDEEYIQKLEKLMEEAPNDQMRQSIQRALDEAQRM